MRGVQVNLFPLFEIRLFDNRLHPGPKKGFQRRIHLWAISEK